MSFRDKVSKLGKTETKVEVEFPNVEEEESKTASKMESKREPKYLFLGFFVHGGYGVDAQPYKANKHASVSIRTFESVPKLMTFMSCTPGNSLIGEEGGLDNIRLSNYFFTNLKLLIPLSSKRLMKYKPELSSLMSIACVFSPIIEEAVLLYTT